MKQLNCMIVDDEPLAVEIIEEYIKKVPWHNCVSTNDRALGALDSLDHNSIDLIFLDIHMPDLSGIKLAKLLNNNTILFSRQPIINMLFKDLSWRQKTIC
ncbi:MAG: two-component system LytT family response regulator [Roseivirga sp.]|jgi:two-component system LytT family response regulator